MDIASRNDNFRETATECIKSIVENSIIIF